jgi:hypothetical protein
MKTLGFVFSSILTIIIAGSCNKTVDNAAIPKGFNGKWTLVEIYGNDHWGGPAHWKTVTADTKIEFTSDGKYFKKYSTDSSYTFIGTFQVLSDSTIKITQANPVNPSYPSYTLNYTFSAGGYMTWGVFGTEALIEEKYHFDN